MKLSVLASGSSGNCIYVASDKTHILIDAGLSGKATRERLASIGVDVASIEAVCITHEHEDHKSALGVLVRRHGVKLFANSGTAEAICRKPELQALPWNIFTTGAAFDIGNLHIEPFSVPHDSYDPVGFAISCNGSRVGIVTDIGIATTVVRERLRNCQTIVLESNHDETLLMESARPWSLKQRIAGRQGHLSNERAADLIVDVASPSLHTVLLAHLSSDCNSPDLALRTVRGALTRKELGHLSVSSTYPDRPTALLDV